MTESAELPQHLEVTANIRAGRPRLRGTRITVDDIVILHLRLGYSLELIVGKYNLSPASVHAAMAIITTTTSKSISRLQTMTHTLRHSSETILRFCEKNSR